MVNQWGKEGKWLVHCHSGRKSARILKSADEVPFDEVPFGLFGA
jgi:rhodanese-related sulfurtransferase